MGGGAMRGEVLGVERRRRWDDEVKLAIVSAVGIDGATVTQVAQRHEVTRQQIYAWRHELKRKGLWSPEAGALFLPAGMAPAMELTVVEPPARAAAPAAWVELRLAKGRVLRFESDIDDAALSRLIRAVDAA
ncbi:transposase [Rhodovulum strictum]